MNKNLILPIILLLFTLKVTAQDFGFSENSCADTVKLQIKLTVADNIYKNIRSSKGSKLSFSNVQLQCNETEAKVKSLKIRGKTSLYFPKKSFTVKLKDPLSITSENGTSYFEDFFLLSLSMDENYVDNYLAYSILKSLNIFNLTFRYCELMINNETQGIYLMMERPHDYVFKTLKSPVLIRRGFNSEIDQIDINEKVYNAKKNYFSKKFTHLYSFFHRYSGTELYDSLNNYIDMRQYMRWLGFNYLVRNGDYTDELFLYYDTVQNRFNIIPWDYDDLFVLYPHEGKEARRAISGGQFIFSSEDYLDQAIIKDQYLYKKYLEELVDISTQLNDNVLFSIFQKTFCAVYPYYLDPAILNVTKFDKYGLTNREKLFSEMQNKLMTMHSMRDLVMLQVKKNSDSAH